jgi:hypothetical protein
VSGHRLGVYLDAENLFDAGMVTAVQTRNPSAVVSGNTVLLGSPTAITAARQLTFGGRWSF